MQITEFEVTKLFGRFDHHVSFPRVSDEDPRPSVVILYGANGVGKTTILRMLAALLSESPHARYDVFRNVPFESCRLQISDVPPIILRANDDGISIEFGKERALLVRQMDPRLHGREDEAVLRGIRRAVLQATRDLSFDYIETARIDRLQIEAERRAREGVVTAHQTQGPLSEKMAQFINFAQLDYRAYFASSQPDLFSKIMERLTKPRHESLDVESLLERLRAVRAQDASTDRLGLERDRWEFETLVQILTNLPSEIDVRENALAVAAQYVEFLETRAAERSLIAARLFTFERVMDEFYTGKKVSVLPREGLRIETEDGTKLDEHKLSSGEHHLLYLMVSAVSTRRRGTVIAIDEPEMSMHIAWQRKLIPALLECAAKAEPQFIFATHSPDLSAEYPHYLVELN